MFEAKTPARNTVNWLWQIGGKSPGLTVCAALLLVLTGVGAVALWWRWHPFAYYVSLIQALIYGVAAFLVVRAPPRGRPFVFAILAIGIIMRAALVVAPPISTDLYRYVWDGRVQSRGINPYLYVPADEHERSLRDDVIFPNINRAEYAPTIYPPAAQFVFFLVTRMSESVTAMKLAMVAFELVTVWVILQLLAWRNKPTTWILLYAWHPLAVWEFAGSGHVDSIAIATLMAAFLASHAHRPFISGVLLGLATLVKFTPIVVGPALYRRWDWRLPLGFLLTLTLCYAPYIGAGIKVFGFLGGYANEEGLENGNGLYFWSLLRAVAPVSSTAEFYLAFVALALAGSAMTIVWKPGRRPDLLGGLWLSAAWTVAISPHYPWYFAWLIPFLCITPSAALLYLTAAAPLLYVVGWPLGTGVQSLLYGPFFAILAVEAWCRRRAAVTNAMAKQATP